MKTESIIIILFAMIAGVTTYAADWQREQDTKLSSMDRLIERQQVLLENQVKYNELKADLANRSIFEYIVPIKKEHK